MNFNGNLSRNKKNSSSATKTVKTYTSSLLSSSTSTSSPLTTTGTNVKTTTAKTTNTSQTAEEATSEAAEVSTTTTTSVGNYEEDIIIIEKKFISFALTSCAKFSTSSSFMFIPHNKKITQLNYSTGMCDTRRRTTTAQSTIPATIATEVMLLPLTSMSSEQITLTSRANIMDKDVENLAVAVVAAKTKNTKVKPLPPPFQSPPPPTPPPLSSPTTATYLPILATAAASASTTTEVAKSCRKHCLNIKMPLRRLILTIMAAVVLSMEFTICNSKSILQQPLTTMSMSNYTYLPTTANKSSNINDNLQNLPVTSTTLSAAAATSITTTTKTMMLALSVSSSSTSSIDNGLPIKSFESAALVENSPSTSSLLASTFDDSSSILLSTLTGTALITQTESPASSIAFEEEMASSELLSVPTSIQNIYNASDLPPLTEAEQAAKDLLTKGFSIPTYLPPFPVFAVADLPAYLNTISSTTTESPATHPRSSNDGYNLNSQENLLYFDNLPDHQQHGQNGQHQHRKLQIPKRNISLALANVTVQVGNHAYLPCHIHRLQNKPVSWVRLRDGHIISVDQTTFIADQRFQAIFQDDKEFTWSLQIKYVQPTDEGWYECQASSEPKMSAKVYLEVVVPLTELIGDQSRFVKAGSKVALHCIVRGTLDPPQYIIWYRDKIQISEDNKMGWFTQLDRNIFGNSGDNQNTIGSLIIPFVRKMDSGNYTCQPSNSASVSVDLHVLSGEYSASAIMSAARTYTLNDYYLLLLLFLLMLLHKT